MLQMPCPCQARHPISSPLQVSDCFMEDPLHPPVVEPWPGFAFMLMSQYGVTCLNLFSSSGLLNFLHNHPCLQPKVTLHNCDCPAMHEKQQTALHIMVSTSVIAGKKESVFLVFDHMQWGVQPFMRLVSIPWQWYPLAAAVFKICQDKTCRRSGKPSRPGGADLPGE